MSDFTAEKGYVAILEVINLVGKVEPRTTGKVQCPICAGELTWHTTHRALYGKCVTPHCIEFHSRGKYKKKTTPARQDSLL